MYFWPHYPGQCPLKYLFRFVATENTMMIYSERQSSFVGASYSYCEQITVSFSIHILLIVVHHFWKSADCVSVVLQCGKSSFAERYLLPHTTVKSKCLLFCEVLTSKDRTFLQTRKIRPPWNKWKFSVKWHNFFIPVASIQFIKIVSCCTEIYHQHCTTITMEKESNKKHCNLCLLQNRKMILIDKIEWLLNLKCNSVWLSQGIPFFLITTTLC